ncbi:MAG: ParB N-terminal domain-containing protein [Chloroflexi bacterium]|nr:ParB N-terminal domain-containing protein [Chloroflexota bacterium]
MSDIVMIPAGPIRKNRAQMRREYDLMKLAELTLQIKSRGFDADRPLLVRQNGDGGYENIRGHRRRMATLMAQHLPPGDWDIEAVREQWSTIAATHDGDVEAAAEALAAEHGDFEVPAVIFAGDHKQATLALWSDNFGDEDPDPLGVAESLLVGIEEFGISPDEAAKHMGQHRNYVDNHLALGQLHRLHADFADRVVREMSMTIAVIVMSLPADKRTALVQFLAATPTTAVTVANVKKTAKLLKELSFEMPLQFPHSTRRNVARAFIKLWHEQLEEAPVRAYLGAAIVLFAHQGYKEPWTDPNLVVEWLKALGVQYTGHWATALEPYLDAVSCATCPIAKLPDTVLGVDVTSPAGLPCRMGYKVQRCLHGIAPGDPFHMRVPMGWSGHPGVKSQAGAYYVDSYDDLLMAWQAQQAAEEAKAEPTAPSTKSSPTASSKKTAKNKKPAQSAPAAEGPAKPAGPSQLEIMRAQVGFYMDAHLTLNTNHFMATQCARCQHKLDGSPTNDPSVPHCAWTSHNRNVEFSKIEPVNGGVFEPIAICQQYAPNIPWREIIPEHPAAGQLPREWMVKYIIALVKERVGIDGYKPFQWLTGRPMNSSERYDDWFVKQLEEQQGDLSDSQVFTLFVMVHDEWKRAKRFGDDGIFHLPVGGAFQLVPAQLNKWKMEQ